MKFCLKHPTQSIDIQVLSHLSMMIIEQRVWVSRNMENVKKVKDYFKN